MPQRTLAQMRTVVWAALDGNTGFYPGVEVIRALNEQVRVANLFTGFIQSYVNVTTEANRYVYALPSPMLIPLAVSLAGKQLRRCALRVLTSQNRTWWRDSTSNTGPVATWIPLGIRRIGIHPTDAVGGRTLKVDGIIEPTALVNDSDVVQADDVVLDGIEQMAVHVLQLKEGGKTFADSTAGYQQFLREMKGIELWKLVKHPKFWIERQQVKEGG